MPAYDAHFLGVVLPLPRFTPARVADILQQPLLTDDGHATYPNYSVVTDKRYRAPAFTVLHIDQSRLKTTKRSNRWQIDSRIGAEWQLDDAYFKNSLWDKGHMADRESAAWGPTLRDAQEAADGTFYYANACLQHKNLNQDEWRGLEEWILKLNLVKDGRVTVFTGPVFGATPRIVTPTGRASAVVPVGFFKVVCYINKSTGQLDVRAFLVYQDTEALQDLRGRRTHNYTNYQVTVTEIEALTGINFPDEVYEQNPLYYHANSPAGTRLNIRSFPERVDINQPEDIIGHGDHRIHVADDDVEVYLTAALVSPTGGAGEEWVSIANFENKAVTVTGWKLIDRAGHTLTLKGKIAPGETLVLRGKKLRPVLLPDKGGLLTLLNAAGDRIDCADYTLKEVAELKGTRGRQSLPLNFLTYRANLRPD